MSDDKRNIYLIGPMGSGKTAVGRQLARDTGLRFVDSDHELERRTGVEIALIFEKEGEEGFRQRKSDMIAEISQMQNVLVATGGGAVLRESNRKHLASTGTVIYLKTSVDEQLKRTRRSQNRPLLLTADRREVLERLACERTPIYEGLADITIDTSGQKVRNVASTLRELLERRGLLPLQK
jgi:shikimate kinase